MTFNARFTGIGTAEQNDATNNHSGEFETVEAAVEFATEHGVDIVLSDDAGFSRGWVHADGTYSLS